jgi:hypothetical protein
LTKAENPIEVISGKNGRQFFPNSSYFKNEQEDSCKKAGDSRIVSVDIFRALTMLLMVFVNDMAGLTNYSGF